MIANFIHHYPAYTAEVALKIPWRRFLALYTAISQLDAQADLRALMVTNVGNHPGERGQAFQQFANELKQRAGITPTQRPSVESATLLARGLARGTEGSALHAELERRRAVAAELQAQHDQRTSAR